MRVNSYLLTKCRSGERDVIDWRLIHNFPEAICGIRNSVSRYTWFLQDTEEEHRAISRIVELCRSSLMAIGNKGSRRIEDRRTALVVRTIQPSCCCCASGDKCFQMRPRLRRHREGVAAIAVIRAVEHPVFVALLGDEFLRDGAVEASARRLEGDDRLRLANFRRAVEPVCLGATSGG